MYTLPTDIVVNGIKYPIRNKGDFRVILDCFEALNDIELNNDMRILTALFIFYDNFARFEDVLILSEEVLVSLVNQMFWFFNCGEEDTNSSSQPYKLIDWEQDEQLVMSAINSVANKEVRLETFVHWWTFMGYYMAIGESSLSFVVSIRKKILQGKKLDKDEREFKAHNPHYFNWNHKSVEEQELDNYMMNLWNKT